MGRSTEFRTLDYANLDELRAYLARFYGIPRELDEYHYDKSDAFIERCIEQALEEETPANTFPGIVLVGSEIIGLHIVRRFEEGPLVGAHIAGLWVAAAHRGRGIARTLKAMGEEWAHSVGADFMNTNINARNRRMREISAEAGFTPYRVNLRKRL